MNESAVLAELQTMDSATLVTFIRAIRENAVLKLAIRTALRGYDIGNLPNVVLDDRFPAEDIAAFLLITRLDEAARKPAVDAWLHAHPMVAIDM